MTKFRPLRAEEVECRVARVDKYGFKYVSLLLYKDARCDQNILDETVGPMNWQRHHSRDNANCIVSIWDEQKAQWIEKEDTGTESNTEAAKGLASDSFKRACFNWGIGRELYTAPSILIWASEKNGNANFEWCTDQKGQLLPKPKADFYVSDMESRDGKITFLQIRNRYSGMANKVVFTWGKKSGSEIPQPEPEPQVPKTWREKTIEVLQAKNVNVKDLGAVKAFLPKSCSSIPIGKETSEEQWQFIYEALTT